MSMCGVVRAGQRIYNKMINRLRIMIIIALGRKRLFEDENNKKHEKWHRRRSERIKHETNSSY